MLQSSPPCPQPPAPLGIVAAAGVVNQADDKRFLQSGYFTTPGLHHTTRFALRLLGSPPVSSGASLTVLCLTEPP